MPYPSAALLFVAQLSSWQSSEGSAVWQTLNAAETTPMFCVFSKGNVFMKKSLIALSVLASVGAMAGGTTGVTAALPTTAAVQLSQGGIGDLLLAPVYMAAGGWNTELKLVNNSTTKSTVAKVVFHDATKSTEILDFFVYLSPGDAWNGTVACVASGSNPCASITMTSTDDSVTIDGTNFASAASPAVYSFSNPAAIGYVGVFEEAAWNLGAAPLAKSVVKARHDADNTAGVTYLEADTANILSGTVRMTNSLNGAASTIPMVAWANYDNTKPLQLGALTAFGSDGGSPSYTSTLQLEDTFWGNSFSLPYNLANGTTIASVTFPTRRTYDGLIHGTGSVGRYPFNNVTAAPIAASITVRDMAEHTIAATQNVTSPIAITARPVFQEVGFMVINQGATTVDPAGYLNTIGTGTFNAGWAQVVFDGFAGVNATSPVGIPAVMTEMNWSVNGNQLRSEWWYPQSYLSTFNN
jgi:hypothetical protein